MPQVMTEIEFSEVAEEYGATYASWEMCDRLLKQWSQEHPDDDRDDYDLIQAADFLAWI